MRPDRRHGRNSEPPTSIYPVDRPLQTGRNYVNGSQTRPQSDDEIAALRTELLAGATTLGVALDDQAADRLLQFLELMRRWNGVYNLTAIRDPHGMLVQHLLDSLAIVPALRRQCGDGPLRLLDVGSGGGLPGVVLAITCPAVQVHCVDAVAKKAGFIRQAGAETLGVALDDQAADRLLQFLELMRRWNGVYNLTAIRDPHGMLVQHLLDSLAVVPALRRQCGDGPLRLLDVGSGGGLPGVVLAITCPAVQVHCVDAVAKKAGFIRQAGAELGLPNLHSHHSRVEQLKQPAFDVVTSRAFASLADFVRWTRPLVAPGGRWLAMKGVQPDAEIAALPADVAMLHVEPIAVPGDPGERCIVWLQPAT